MQTPGGLQQPSPAPISVSTIRGASAADVIVTDSGAWDHGIIAGRTADPPLRKQARVVALICASLIALGMLWMTLAP